MVHSILVTWRQPDSQFNEYPHLLYDDHTGELRLPDGSTIVLDSLFQLIPSGLETENERFHERIDELEGELEDEERNVYRLESLLDDKDDTIVELEDDLEQLQRDYDDLMRERNNFLSRLRDLEEEYEETMKSYNRWSLSSLFDNRENLYAEDPMRVEDMERMIVELNKRK